MQIEGINATQEAHMPPHGGPAHVRTAFDLNEPAVCVPVALPSTSWTQQPPQPAGGWALAHEPQQASPEHQSTLLAAAQQWHLPPVTAAQHVAVAVNSVVLPEHQSVPSWQVHLDKCSPLCLMQNLASGKHHAAQEVA